MKKSKSESLAVNWSANSWAANTRFHMKRRQGIRTVIDDMATCVVPDNPEDELEAIAEVIGANNQPR